MWKENIKSKPMRQKKNYKGNKEDFRRKKICIGYWKERNDKEKRAEGLN